MELLERFDAAHTRERPHYYRTTRTLSGRALFIARGSRRCLCRRHHRSGRSTSVKHHGDEPRRSLWEHIVKFDPATGDVTCTGTSKWTGSWTGSTTWKLDGDNDRREGDRCA